jgi:hypothetical protein
MLEIAVSIRNYEGRAGACADSYFEPAIQGCMIRIRLSNPT